jgi:hypothetical protein
MSKQIFNLGDNVKFLNFNYVVSEIKDYDGDGKYVDIELVGFAIDPDVGERVAGDTYAQEDLIADIQKFEGTVNGKNI